METITIHGKEFKKYLDEPEISIRVKEIAKELEVKYSEDIPVFLIILSGASFFAIDLIKNFTPPCQTAFMQLSSYEGTASTMEVKTLSEPNIDFAGRRIIILEDIIDTGLTMNYLIDKLKYKNPTSIEVVSLLDKPSRRVNPVDIGIIGFEIPDLFVVGYGLDYNELGRNYPSIYAEV